MVLAAPAFTNIEVKETLREILARPEFILSRVAVSWADRAAALMERLLSGKIGSSAEGAAWWLYPVLIVSFIVVCLLVFFVISRLSGSFSPDKAIEDEKTAELEKIDYSRLRERAAVLAENGEFRDAVRYLYLSLLLFLDNRQLISFRLSKTNREYLSELRKSSRDMERFAGLVQLFERKWYGMEDCTESDYLEFRATYLGLTADRGN